MNEKIKQLARQADLYAFVSDESIDPDIEKFAELIVRECAQIARGNEDDTTARQIESRFGVEE